MAQFDSEHTGFGFRSGASQKGRVNPLVDAQSPTAAVAHRIGREIIAGTYPPDGLLPNEAVMLERYSVSRTSLREAYSKLTAKGLISARPKVGTSVRPRAFWNMLDSEVLSWHLQTIPAADMAQDLYALRRMIEPGAAELAAEHHSDDDMAQIDAAFAEMRSNQAVEVDLIEADLRFHLAVLTATQNPFISAFSALIHAAMLTTFQLSWRGAEVIKDKRLEQHGAVANAIRAGNARQARLTMEKLLDDSLQDVSGALAARDK
ncbi:MAG: FadR/GntR family transcriptional regulator [Deltaproteobacteria bacterium]